MKGILQSMGRLCFLIFYDDLFSLGENWFRNGFVGNQRYWREGKGWGENTWKGQDMLKERTEIEIDR